MKLHHDHQDKLTCHLVNLVVSQENTNSTGCTAECDIRNVDNDSPLYWGWVYPTDVESFSLWSIETTETVTRVTVVNTLLHQTSVTTVAAPTANEEGTAIQIISFSRSQDSASTTVTLYGIHPTPMVLPQFSNL